MVCRCFGLGMVALGVMMFFKYFYGPDGVRRNWGFVSCFGIGLFLIGKEWTILGVAILGISGLFAARRLLGREFFAGVPADLKQARAEVREALRKKDVS